MGSSWEDASVEADFVFVHGFTQTPASWDPVIEAMHYADDSVRLFIAPRVAAEGDFRRTAAALGVAEATYIGYSQGGRLCLQLALDRPELVRSLVLVSASPGIADASERAARRDADERIAREIERDGVDVFLERWLSQPLFATLPSDRVDLDARRAANTIRSLTSQLRLLGQGAQPSNWDRLGELRVPVLLVVGELDAKYVDVAHRMAEQIPDARVEVVRGAGHACHLERPDDVAHLLTSFA
jgi:2-succinyl-6-hydroxy-2,4-cyclohexadiene-1-carboxylate synthase